MTDRLDLPQRYRRILERLLREHVPEAEVWAYGSRITGESHEGSDLDLVVRGPDLKPLEDGFFELLDAIEQSNIPILVQAHDWARLPESFHHEIERDFVVFQDTCRKETTNGEWIDCTLADACSAIDYGLTASASNSPHGPKFLRITDIVSGQLNWNTVSNVETDDKTMQKYRLCNGDIVLARTGASTGASSYINDPPDSVFASYLVRLKAKPEFDSRFIGYYLKSKAFRDYMSGVLGDKSAQPNASASTMAAAPFSAPRDRAKQTAIAHILGTLDDKIELNRRMNETLEEMARALFKSWFVDYDPVRAKVALASAPSEESDWTRERARAYLDRMDKNVVDFFPDQLVDSELGEIPEGWEVKALGDVAEVVGGTTPSTKVKEYWDGGTHCWATPKDLSNLSSPVLLDTERMITEGGLAKIGSGLLPKGTLLLSSRAPIGYVAISEVPVAINQGFIGVPPGDMASNFVLLYWCSAFHDLIVNHANGSTFLEISKRDFRLIPIVMPDEAVIHAFDVYARSIHQRIASNERESRKLTAQRDSLLPRLVSGEVGVSNEDRSS